MTISIMSLVRSQLRCSRDIPLSRWLLSQHACLSLPRLSSSALTLIGHVRLPVGNISYVERQSGAVSDLTVGHAFALSPTGLLPNPTSNFAKYRVFQLLTLTMIELQSTLSRTEGIPPRQATWPLPSRTRSPHVP
jgi:hypothetical protein